MHNSLNPSSLVSPELLNKREQLRCFPVPTKGMTLKPILHRLMLQRLKGATFQLMLLSFKLQWLLHLVSSTFHLTQFSSEGSSYRRIYCGHLRFFIHVNFVRDCSSGKTQLRSCDRWMMPWHLKRQQVKQNMWLFLFRWRAKRPSEPVVAMAGLSGALQQSSGAAARPGRAERGSPSTGTWAGALEAGRRAGVRRHPPSVWALCSRVPEPLQQQAAEY